MTTDNWKTSPPAEPGLYIASAARAAGYVRYWTGQHWTAPLSVADLHMTDRIPNADGVKAVTYNNRAIVWLEKVTIDGSGFLSWGGLQDDCPVAPDMVLRFKIRAGAVSDPQRGGTVKRWSHDGKGGDIVAYKVGGDIVPAAAANEPHVRATPLPAACGIGDINSSAKGSGARFNAGKADLALIPLRLLADSFIREKAQKPEHRRASEALGALGAFQQTHDKAHLYAALRILGLENWQSCAKVFEYGKKKYAAWNWSKGMQWSVALACAARHIVFGILAGEERDAESGELHVGHVFCNIVMLLTFIETYAEGNDLPTQWLEAA